MMKTTVGMIATYNELENLRGMIPALLALPEVTVLIVDDNSPDGSPAYLREYAKREPRLVPLIRESKQGYGTAVLAGFRYALELGADYIVTLDADFSHNPNDIPRLLEAVTEGRGNADVAIGSRYVNGIRIINWEKSRLFLSLFANIYVKTILGFKVEDATSGFRAYKRNAVETVLQYPPRSQGYSFLSEILFTLCCRQARVTEVPIIYTERRVGQSKMSGGVIGEAILRPWVLVFKRVFRVQR